MYRFLFSSWFIQILMKKKMTTINQKASKQRRKKSWKITSQKMICSISRFEFASYLSLMKAIWQTLWKFDYFHSVWCYGKARAHTHTQASSKSESNPQNGWCHFLYSVHHVKRILKVRRWIEKRKMTNNGRRRQRHNKE